MLTNLTFVCFIIIKMHRLVWSRKHAFLWNKSIIWGFFLYHSKMLHMIDWNNGFMSWSDHFGSRYSYICTRIEFDNFPTSCRCSEWVHGILLTTYVWGVMMGHVPVHPSRPSHPSCLASLADPETYNIYMPYTFSPKVLTQSTSLTILAPNISCFSWSQRQIFCDYMAGKICCVFCKTYTCIIFLPYSVINKRGLPIICSTPQGYLFVLTPILP